MRPFLLLKFLSENKARWYPTNSLVNLLWPDPGKTPIAAKQALARSKKRITDLLSTYLDGQDDVESWPHNGYRMKPHLDSSGKSS